MREEDLSFDEITKVVCKNRGRDGPSDYFKCYIYKGSDKRLMKVGLSDMNFINIKNCPIVDFNQGELIIGEKHTHLMSVNSQFKGNHRQLNVNCIMENKSN